MRGISVNISHIPLSWNITSVSEEIFKHPKDEIRWDMNTCWNWKLDSRRLSRSLAVKKRKSLKNTTSIRSEGIKKILAFAIGHREDIVVYAVSCVC